MRLIVSGSRDGFSQARIDEILDGYLVHYQQLTIIEGCAPGVDRQSEDWARRHGAAEMLGRERGYRQPAIARIVLEHWPAEWTKHGGCWCGPDKPRCNFAGHRRNAEMASASPDELAAFHPDIRNSKGTRRMVAIAHKRRIPYHLIGSVVPDEEIEEWAA